MSTDRVAVTCSLTGIFTNPAQHPVPVTPEEMAASAKEAFDAGASIMHIHFRQQEPGMGNFPSWDPEIATAIADAIRASCPGVILNFTTGIVGDAVEAPIGCLEAGRPEMAAMNAGSLNYLRTRRNGDWAWPPMLFDNPVAKVDTMLKAMDRLGIVPECECFDTGIVRSIRMYIQRGMLTPPPFVSLVMGVSSGMPARNDLLPILLDELPEDARWQAIVIGREEVWPVHRRASELGGSLRAGLEDTFYMPDGCRARGNGDLIEALVRIARDTGREPMSPEETRQHLGIGASKS